MAWVESCSGPRHVVSNLDSRTPIDDVGFVSEVFRGPDVCR